MQSGALPFRPLLAEGGVVELLVPHVWPVFGGWPIQALCWLEWGNRPDARVGADPTLGNYAIAGQASHLEGFCMTQESPLDVANGTCLHCGVTAVE